MLLTHKSFCVQASIWKQLRINAELSGVPVRDFLAYLIEASQPVPEGPEPQRQRLDAIVNANRQAAATGTSGASAASEE